MLFCNYFPLPTPTRHQKSSFEADFLLHNALSALEPLELASLKPPTVRMFFPSSLSLNFYASTNTFATIHPFQERLETFVCSPCTLLTPCLEEQFPFFLKAFCKNLFVTENRHFCSFSSEINHCATRFIEILFN